MHSLICPFRIAAVALAAALSTPIASAAPDPVLGERVLKLTRGTKWNEVAAIKVGFKTHHPQGMIKIGDERASLEARKALLTPVAPSGRIKALGAAVARR